MKNEIKMIISVCKTKRAQSLFAPVLKAIVILLWSLSGLLIEINLQIVYVFGIIGNKF